MRRVIDPQMKIGEKAIASIKFDLRCRDEIPKLLRGLQAIYCNRELREKVFAVLAEIIRIISIPTMAARAWICGKYSSWAPCGSTATGIMINSMTSPIITKHSGRCSAMAQWMPIISIHCKPSRRISPCLHRRCWTKSISSLSSTVISWPVKKKIKN